MTRSVPLSAEARRLLELGSEVEPPTSEQNDRMDRALAPLFRTGRPGPAPVRSGNPLGIGVRRGSGAERSQTRVRTAQGFLEPVRRFLETRFLEPYWLRDAKLWLTLGALTATASASFWLGRTSLPAEEARALAAPAAPHDIAQHDIAQHDVVGAGPALAGNSASFGHDAASVEPPAREAAVRENPGVRRGNARPQHSHGLGAEIEQLARAEAALRQGRAARALRVLERQTVLHLLEQAAALRAIAECELGVTTASVSAGEVLARWPSSAFQPRIVQACGL